MQDDYDLQRFLTAQAPVYDDALAMLRHGMMCAPYMDFVFPRIVGAYDRDDISPFALQSLDEARAFLAFPVLGNRYRECVEALDWLFDTSASAIFGDADARLLQASLTLFAEATAEPVLRTMLTIWFDDLADAPTVEALARQA